MTVAKPMRRFSAIELDGTSLVLPVPIDKEAFIASFDDEDLGSALAPIETAMNRILAAKPWFNRLVKAIRAKHSAFTKVWWHEPMRSFRVVGWVAARMSLR